ncbi:MAG: cation-transporting P-type ATPase, partial [Anaerolineae bacterium]
MHDWYRLSIAYILKELGTDAEQGLGEEQANNALRDHGPNELIERAAKSP